MLQPIRAEAAIVLANQQLRPRKVSQGQIDVTGRIVTTCLFSESNRNPTNMEGARKSLLLVLVLSLCAAVLGDEKRVKEGVDVELPCNYPAAYQNPRIEWKFNSGQDVVLVYYNNELTVPYKDRAQFYPQGLLLKGVSRRDAGEYVCEVTDNSSGKPLYTDIRTQLSVLVPPAVPVARVPTSVTIGSSATLQCVENEGFPRPTYSWYKNKVVMPPNPKTSPTFQNSSYVIDASTGDLTFNPVTQSDSGEFHCEASNTEGRQISGVVFMETHERNVGAIVAAVIIVLLILALIAFGLWFAYSRGYIGKKANKKVIYSQPSETRSDKNFQQTSSFVV